METKKAQFSLILSKNIAKNNKKRRLIFFDVSRAQQLIENHEFLFFTKPANSYSSLTSFATLGAKLKPRWKAIYKNEYFLKILYTFFAVLS